MSIPSTPSYSQIPSNLSELLKIGNNNQKLLNKGLTNVTKITNLTKKRVTQVDNLYKSFNKRVKEIDKLAKKSNKITDLLKKGKFKQVNPKLGNAIGFALNLASIGLSLLTINQIGKLQEIDLRINGIIQRDVSNAFTRAINNTLTLRKVREDFNNFVKQYKRDKDKLGANIYANLQNLVTTRELAEAGKKQANEALYETRVGRQKVEAKISELFNQSQQLISDVANQNAELANRTEEARRLGNEALYETRAGREILRTEINQKFQASRKLANDALYEARANRQKLEANFGKQLNSLRNNLNLEVKNIERKTAQQVNSLFNGSKGIINNALSQARTAQANAKSAQAEARGLQQQLNQLRGDENRLNFKSPDLNIAPTVNNLIANSPQIKSLLAALKAANVKLDGFEIQVPINTKAIQNVATNVLVVDGRITKLERGVEIKGLNIVNSRIEGANAKIRQLDVDFNKNVDEIKKLDKQFKDREKLDNKQYNDLLGKIALLPALIAKVPSDTVRRMPKPLTASQLETATGSAVCKSTRPGGCMNKALSDNANQINQNTNNWGSNLLNGINTGANADQLGLLKVIDGKLGPKIGSQGLSGAVKNIFENKLVDRALQVATLATTTHNALMLSNNLAQTLFSATDNILKVVGIKIKDEKGSEIGIQQVVNSLFLNFANSLFGAENVKSMNANFKKANRIYQAGANIVNSVRSIVDSTRNVSEFIAENTGKIGNALMKYGAIAANAFPKLPEQVNAQSIWVQRLNNLEEAASGIEMVTGEVLQITENVKEIKKQTDDFNKGVEELSPKERKDNKPVKEREDKEIAESQSPFIPTTSERSA